MYAMDAMKTHLYAYYFTIFLSLWKENKVEQARKLQEFFNGFHIQKSQIPKYPVLFSF